ncbi:MAG: hypothetical protein ABIY55_33470 [Kofleriaceae bacterium]
MNRTGASAAGPSGAAGRSGDALTNIVEVLERGRGPRGDRSVAPELIDLSDLLPHRWKQRRDAVAALCAALARLGRGD